MKPIEPLKYRTKTLDEAPDIVKLADKINELCEAVEELREKLSIKYEKCDLCGQIREDHAIDLHRFRHVPSTPQPSEKPNHHLVGCLEHSDNCECKCWCHSSPDKTQEEMNNLQNDLERIFHDLSRETIGWSLARMLANAILEKYIVTPKK